MNEIHGYYNCFVHPGGLNVVYNPLIRRSRYSGSDPDYSIKSLDDNPNPEQSLRAVRSRPVQFENNRTRGQLSQLSRKKLLLAVAYIVFLSPKQKYYHAGTARSGQMCLNFITLTLSCKQIHSDNEIRDKILDPFLRELARRFRGFMYVWRAESQTNGNIHFHLVTNRYIWWPELRSVWNFHQERLGYVSAHRSRMQAYFAGGFHRLPGDQDHRSTAAQHKAYCKEVQNDWNSPNSTDVHALRYIGSVQAYITKYVSKEETNRQIKGHLWGCSQNLMNLRGAECFAEGVPGDEIDKIMNTPGIYSYVDHYFTAIRFKLGFLNATDHPYLYKQLQTYLQQKFPDYLHPELLSSAA